MSLFNFYKIEKETKYGVETEKKVLIVPKAVAVSAIGLFGLITIFSSFKTIKSGEVGLKVRFGKIVDNSLEEGFNFKIPYIEKIVKVNIKVQKAELTAESSTKDMQIINSAIAVNYRVDNKKASHLYKTVGNSYEETILNPAIKESFKNAIAQYNAEEITTKRGEVSISCLKTIQEKVAKYGIVVEDFNLTDFSFSAEYTKAIEEKQVAEQKVETAKQELEKAKVESEKKIIEAEATNKANELLKQNVTDEVLMKQFIEKWDGKLPATYAGQDLMSIFNLN